MASVMTGNGNALHSHALKVCEDVHGVHTCTSGVPHTSTSGIDGGSGCTSDMGCVSDVLCVSTCSKDKGLVISPPVIAEIKWLVSEDCVSLLTCDSELSELALVSMTQRVRVCP